MNEFEKIKKMYDSGFRCIRYDDTKDGYILKILKMKIRRL